MHHDLLRTLIQSQEAPCVSLYVPLQAGAAHAEDNVKRMLAALDEVEGKLQDTGLSPKGQKQFLASARSFAEGEGRALTDGGTVALFLTPSAFHHILLLKTDEEGMAIGPRFHLTPLLPYAAAARRYFLLTVSKKAAHFYAVTNDRIEEREVEGMPRSMEEAWAGMERQEKSLQTHSTQRGETGLHGHGGAKDVEEQEEDRYMQELAKSLHTLLREERLPLVFAGVTELFGMFRAFDKSDCLLDRSVGGSPDATTLEDMKEKADAIAAEHLEGQRERLLEEYGALTGTGRTSTDPAAILDAALRGKVDLLFMAEGAEAWGRLDTEQGTAEIHGSRENGDEELLGLAAAHTIAHRGRLVPLDASHMPDGSTMAAILRY